MGEMAHRLGEKAHEQGTAGRQLIESHLDRALGLWRPVCTNQAEK